MHYYKRNIGDYAKKAGRLTLLQHGVYNLLIDACYDRERFPNVEEAIDWVWASTTEEEEAVRFVLRKFFTLENDGTYTQKRIQDELDAYHAKSENNKRIANEREAKRKGKTTKRERNVNETCEKENEAPPNQEPLTNNHNICDYSVVIAAYREVLVSAGRPNILDARFSGSVTQSQIKARWKEHPNHQTKEFWEGFFNTVKLNDFWMGKGSWAKGVNLEWLTKRANFDKVLEQWNEAVENG